MKKLILLYLLLAPAIASADIYGVGTMKCREYIGLRPIDDQQRVIQVVEWAKGFLSGAAITTKFYNQSVVYQHTQDQDIHQFLSNYCRSDPQQSDEVAISALAVRLQKLPE